MPTRTQRPVALDKDGLPLYIGQPVEFIPPYARPRHRFSVADRTMYGYGYHRMPGGVPIRAATMHNSNVPAYWSMRSANVSGRPGREAVSVLERNYRSTSRRPQSRLYAVAGVSTLPRPVAESILTSAGLYDQHAPLSSNLLGLAGIQHRVPGLGQQKHAKRNARKKVQGKGVK